MITKLPSHKRTWRDLKIVHNVLSSTNKGFPGDSHERKGNQRWGGFFQIQRPDETRLSSCDWNRKEPGGAGSALTTNVRRGWKAESTGAYLMSAGCFFLADFVERPNGEIRGWKRRQGDDRGWEGMCERQRDEGSEDYKPNIRVEPPPVHNKLLIQ